MVGSFQVTEDDEYDGTQVDIRWHAVPPDEIAYGILGNDTVVFVPRRYGEALGDLRMALWSSTWGELRSSVSAVRFARILERYRDNESNLADGLPPEIPSDDEEFNHSEIWGYSDGDMTSTGGHVLPTAPCGPRAQDNNLWVRSGVRWS